jgi:hypothetical protein
MHARLSGNHSNAHAPDVDGKPARAVFELNYSIIPLRPPALPGAAVTDMLKYVSMELANGALAGRSRYISEGPLAASAASQGAGRQGRGVRHGPDGRLDVRVPSCITAATWSAFTAT